MKNGFYMHYYTSSYLNHSQLNYPITPKITLKTHPSSLTPTHLFQPPTTFFSPSKYKIIRKRALKLKKDLPIAFLSGY